MTKRHNMSRGERFEVAEKKLHNLEMSQRVAQMLIQQMGNAISPMAKDLGELAGRQRDVQYRLLAIQELLNLNVADVDARAEVLQVKDFNEASDKEDADKGYTHAEVVTDDSAVIITSKIEGGNGGISRSKLIVKDIGFPELRKDLVGKVVGDVVSANINNAIHLITVLGIRNVPTPPPAPSVQLVVAPPSQESSTTDGAAQQQ